MPLYSRFYISGGGGNPYNKSYVLWYNIKLLYSRLYIPGGGGGGG